MRKITCVFSILFLATLPASADDLNAVLARVDSAAAGFRSMVADYERLEHTAILNDTSKESGVFKMIKRRPDDVLALIDIVKPDPTTVALSGQKAEVYRPKMAVVEEYDLRKYKNLVEQFLLLGFGSSGKDLTRSYNVKLAGSETIDGKPAWRLELVPKDKKTREQFNRIELWINADGYPVRQRFHEPNGNHRTVNYSNIKVNQDISAADLALKLPANVKREYPQK